MIVTSSSLTIFGTQHKEDGATYDEGDTAEMEKDWGYIASKLIEEQKFMEFCKSE